MDFEPKLPRDSINVSNEHPLKEAAILVLGLGAVFALLFVALLWFVDIVVALVPQEAEARVFASWGLTELDILTDGDDVAAVQRVLDRLLEHAPESSYRFRVGILPDGEANALALPGGLILVSEGLLEGVRSENELALVLGHEVGHYQNRDHLRGLGRGLVMGVALATVFGSAHERLSLGEVVGQLTLKGFGRESERRADCFGLGLVVAAYGHTAGATDFFSRLQETGRGTDRLVAYLSTHPSNEGRIDDLNAFAAEQGWSSDGEPVPFP